MTSPANVLPHIVSNHFLPQGSQPLALFPHEEPLLPLQIEKLKRMKETIIHLRPSTNGHLELKFVVVDLIKYVEKELSKKLGTHIECLVIGSLADPFNEDFNDIDLKIYIDNPDYSFIRHVLVEFIKDALSKHPDFDSTNQDLTPPIIIKNYFENQCIFSDEEGAFYSFQGISFTIFNTRVPHMHAVSPSDGVQIIPSRNTMRLALGEQFALDANAFQAAMNSLLRGEYLILNPSAVRDLFLRMRFKRTTGRKMDDQLFSFAIQKFYADYPSKEQFQSKFLHHQNQHYPHFEGKLINLLNWLYNFQHDPQKCQWLAETWSEQNGLVQLIQAHPQKTPLLLSFISSAFFFTHQTMSLTCDASIRWKKRTYYFDQLFYMSPVQTALIFLDLFPQFKRDIKALNDSLSALNIQGLDENSEHIAKAMLTAFDPDLRPQLEDPRIVYARLQFKKPEDALRLLYQKARADLQYCQTLNMSIKNEQLGHCLYLIIKALKSAEGLSKEEVLFLASISPTLMHNQILVQSGLAQTYHMALVHIAPTLITAILKNPELLPSAYILYQNIKAELSREEEKKIVHALFLAFDQLPKTESLVMWSCDFIRMALQKNYLENKLFYKALKYLIDSKDPTSLKFLQTYVEPLLASSHPETFSDLFISLVMNSEQDARAHLLFTLHEQRKDFFIMLLRNEAKIAQIIATCASTLSPEKALELLYTALKVIDCPDFNVAVQKALLPYLKGFALLEKCGLIAVALMQKDSQLEHKDFHSLILPLLSQGSKVGVELLELVDLSVEGSTLQETLFEHLVLAALQKNHAMIGVLVQGLTAINKKTHLMDLSEPLEKEDMATLILQLHTLIKKGELHLRQKEPFKQCMAAAKELIAKKIDLLPLKEKIDVLIQQVKTSPSERKVKQLINILKSKQNKQDLFPQLIKTVQVLIEAQKTHLAQTFFEHIIHLLDISQTASISLLLLQSYLTNDPTSKFVRSHVKILATRQDSLCTTAPFLQALKVLCSGSIEELKSVANQMQSLLKQRLPDAFKPVIVSVLDASLKDKETHLIGFGLILDLLQQNQLEAEHFTQLMKIIAALSSTWKTDKACEKEIKDFLDLLLHNQYLKKLEKENVLTLLQAIQQLRKEHLSSFIWEALQQTNLTPLLANYLLEFHQQHSQVEDFKNSATLLKKHYKQALLQSDQTQLKKCAIKIYTSAQDKERWLDAYCLFDISMLETAYDLLRSFCFFPIHECDSEQQIFWLLRYLLAADPESNAVDSLMIKLIDYLSGSKDPQIIDMSTNLLKDYVTYRKEAANKEFFISNFIALCERQNAYLPLITFYQDVNREHWTKEELISFGKKIDALCIKRHKALEQAIAEIPEFSEDSKAAVVKTGKQLKEAIPLFHFTYPEKGQQIFQAYFSKAKEFFCAKSKEDVELTYELINAILVEYPLFQLRRIGVCQSTALPAEEQRMATEKIHSVFGLLITFFVSSSHSTALVAANTSMQNWQATTNLSRANIPLVLSFHERISLAHIFQALATGQIEIFIDDYLRGLKQFLHASDLDDDMTRQGFLNHLALLYKRLLLLPELLPCVQALIRQGEKGNKSNFELFANKNGVGLMAQMSGAFRMSMQCQSNLGGLSEEIKVADFVRLTCWSLSLLKQPSEWDAVYHKSSNAMLSKMTLKVLDLYTFFSKKLIKLQGNRLYAGLQVSTISELYELLDYTYAPILNEQELLEFENTCQMMRHTFQLDLVQLSFIESQAAASSAASASGEKKKKKKKKSKTVTETS
jgi:hypothetical protein